MKYIKTYEKRYTIRTLRKCKYWRFNDYIFKYLGSIAMAGEFDNVRYKFEFLNLDTNEIYKENFGK